MSDRLEDIRARWEMAARLRAVVDGPVSTASAEAYARLGRMGHVDYVPDVRDLLAEITRLRAALAVAYDLVWKASSAVTVQSTVRPNIDTFLPALNAAWELLYDEVKGEEHTP